MLSRLEISYHIGETEWLKMPCHFVRYRMRDMEEHIKNKNNNSQGVLGNG